MEKFKRGEGMSVNDCHKKLIQLANDNGHNAVPFLTLEYSCGERDYHWIFRFDYWQDNGRGLSHPNVFPIEADPMNIEEAYRLAVEFYTEFCRYEREGLPLDELGFSIPESSSEGLF